MGELKKNTISNLVLSIVFLLFGLMLTFKPDFTVNVIISVIGAVIIAFGVLKIINYFNNNNKSTSILKYDLLMGLIGLVIGISVIVFGKMVIAFFRIIIGIWIIYNAILRLELTSLLKKSNSSSWIYVCILAVIMFICGMYITFNSHAIISTIGIVIMVYSVIDLIQNIITLKNLKNVIIR